MKSAEADREIGGRGRGNSLQRTLFERTFREDHLEDGLRGVCHEDIAAKVGVFREVR